MEINQNITDHRDIFENFFYMSRWAMPVARATPHIADVLHKTAPFQRFFLSDLSSLSQYHCIGRQSALEWRWNATEPIGTLFVKK